MRKTRKKRRSETRRRISLESLETRATPAVVVAVVDDFDSQPHQSEVQAGQEFAFRTNLGSDRGEIKPASGGEVDWFEGSARAYLTQDYSFAGQFFGLDGVVRDGGSVNFHAVMHGEIASEFQPSVEALLFEFNDAVGPVSLKLEHPSGTSLWAQQVVMTGGPRELRFELPESGLTEVGKIVVTVDGLAGNFYELDRVALELQTPEQGELEPVVWSYSTLRSNFDDQLGIAADRKIFPAADVGNVPATAGTALAAALMAEAGVVSESAATDLVVTATNTILSLPRMHGVLPHFTVWGGQSFQIIPNSEYSTIDTTVAAFSLVEARQLLGLSTEPIEDLLRDIEWEMLILANGTISHGFWENGGLIPTGWDVWSSESFLVNLAYAAARPEAPLADLTNTSPPTFNGAYFNDELAALLFDMSSVDVWGNNWASYRPAAATAHTEVFAGFGTPICCLSPAEVAEPWKVADGDIYQAFGRGGINDPNTGEALTGHMHSAAHGLGLLASHEPEFARAGWDFLVEEEVLSPLNAVESYYVVQDSEGLDVVANPLKSGWNLFMQAVGWARAASGEHYAPYDAATDIPFVAAGFARLMPADTTAPTGTIVINGGAAYTTSRAINLGLTAEDDLSGVSEMRFSINDTNDASFGAWEPFATEKTLTLPNYQGTNYVNVHFRDQAGNIRRWVWDSIVLDTSQAASV